MSISDMKYYKNDCNCRVFNDFKNDLSYHFRRNKFKYSQSPLPPDSSPLAGTHPVRFRLIEATFYESKGQVHTREIHFKVCISFINL